MKTIKRKAKRIVNRPSKKLIANSDKFAGDEEAMLNKSCKNNC